MRCLSSRGSGSDSIGTYSACNRRPIAVRASCMRAYLSRDGTGIDLTVVDLGMALSRELLRLDPQTVRLPVFACHDSCRDPQKSILRRLSRSPHPFNWHIPRFTTATAGPDSLRLVSSYPDRPSILGPSEWR